MSISGLGSCLGISVAVVVKSSGWWVMAGYGGLRWATVGYSGLRWAVAVTVTVGRAGGIDLERRSLPSTKAR